MRSLLHSLLMGKVTLSADVDPRSLFVGMFWKQASWVEPPVYHAWICPLPCLVIHVEVHR